MTELKIPFDATQRDVLNRIAVAENKTLAEIVSELISDFCLSQPGQRETIHAYSELYDWMDMSESSFSEWDNEEDEIYNQLSFLPNS